MYTKLLTCLSLIGLTAILSACTSLGSGANSQPLPSLASVLTEHPLYKAPYSFSRSAAPLVARYYRIEKGDRPEYWGLTYQPRQSKFQGYEGWDVLDIPGWMKSENRSDWLRIQLSRPAKVAVVWERNELWLSGWNRGSLTVSGKTQNVFTKEFPAGEIALGSPGPQGDGYFVLLAEQGGAPSSEPPLPPGIAAGEKPLPNQDCPSWLENAWTLRQVYGVSAPDGADYKTWHPQIDPIYWCYYAHDHGSDPSLVGYKPAFGYVAKLFNGQAELHVGFKGFAVRQEGTNLGWYVNIHSETGVVSRACARFHTVVVAVTDLKTGQLQAELGYKGDFGATKSNQDNNPTVDVSCPVNPRTGQLESQAQIANQTNASKRLRVFNGDNDRGGYEQWDGGLSKSLGMSFGGLGMGIDIRNPATGCNDMSCTAAKVTGSEADLRTIHFNNLKVRYTREIEAQDLRDGTRDGYFWTDLYGDPLPADKAPGDPGTIRQFIRPGFESAGSNTGGLSGFYTNQDAWRGLYLEGGHVPGINLEGGLGSLN